MTSEIIPLKGPFWLICELDKGGNIVPEAVVSCPVELSQSTPSHQTIWDFCRGSIKKAWNYYPRGRVEIRRGKAIVFANPYCFEDEHLSEKLYEQFRLGDMAVVLKADNSVHYTKGVFEE